MGLFGRIECRPVGVTDVDTGEYLGTYGEGRKSWLHRWHCCGTLCNGGINGERPNKAIDDRASTIKS